jgi:hypothetical protein
MWCSECKQKTEVVYNDYGTGHFDYWGYEGWDSNIYPVSSCCEVVVYKDVCPDCNSIGHLNGETCYTCLGIGYIKEIES